MSLRLVFATALLILTACNRQTAPGIYRLVNTGPARILVPPGVSDPGLAARTFDYRPQRPVRSTCRSTNDALRMEPRRGLLRITVQRAPLMAHPAPWLADWAASLEQPGCLSPGEGAILAGQIVESVPANPSDAHRLLHAGSAISGFLDLPPGYRLKLVSPILREGASAGASALATDTVSGTDSKLSLTVKSSKDFLGYEISWYAIEANPPAHANQRQPGTFVSRVVFSTAESHLGNQVTTSAQPRNNYLAFPETAAYYRLFYLTRVSQADHNVAILSASTRAELDRQTPAFNSDPDACGKAAPHTCVALPKEVAVTAYVTVTANGAPLAVAAESSVADALRAAGIAQPPAALPTLTIRRGYKGAPVAVEFDRSKPDILTLTLTGNEDLRW
jgi:hypothetical protein